MADVIQKIFDIQLNYDGVAKKLVDLTERNAELAKSEKDLKKQFKDGTITANQYAKSLAPITQEKKKNTEVINKCTKAFQTEIKSQRDEIESVTQLQTRLENLANVYNSLSAKQKRSAAGISMSQEMANLATQINQSTQKIAQQTATLDKSSTSINGLKTKIEELRQEYMNLSKTQRESQVGKDMLANIQQLTKDYNTQIDVLKKATNGINQNADSVNGLRERLKTLIAAYDNLSKKEREASTGTDLLKHIKSVKKELEEAEQATGRFSRNVGNYMSALKGFGMRALNIVGGVTTIAQWFVKLGDAMKSGVQTAIEYNREISKLAAILQTDVNGVSRLSAQAKQLGATTRYTAREVASLQVELAKLGYQQGQIVNMSESVLYLAQATGSNLADAASLAGAALRIYGDDSSKAAMYIDQMAVATAKSALSFDYIKTALPIVGGAAEMFGFTLKDTLALVGQLANSGMEASMAATATRNIFLKLADSNGELAKQLGQPVKTLPDLINGLRTLRERGADLNDALELTNVRAAVAFTRLLKSADGAERLAKEMDNCSGAAKRMADTMEENLGGDITRLGSAWDDFVISLSSNQGKLRTAVQWLTKIANKMGDIVRSADESVKIEANKKLGEKYSADSEYMKQVEEQDYKDYQDLVAKYVKQGMTRAKAEIQAAADVEDAIAHEQEVLDAIYDKRVAKTKEVSEEMDKDMPWYRSGYSSKSTEMLKSIKNSNKEWEEVYDAVYNQGKHFEYWKQNDARYYKNITKILDVREKESDVLAKRLAQDSRMEAFRNRAERDKDKDGDLGIDKNKNKRLQREKSAAKALLDAQIAYENSSLKIRMESRKKQEAALKNQYDHEIERLKYKIKEELKMRGDESAKEREDKLKAIDFYEKTIKNKEEEYRQKSIILTKEWTEKEYKYLKELYDLKIEALGNNTEAEKDIIKKTYDMRFELLEKEKEKELDALEAQALQDENIAKKKVEMRIAIEQKYSKKAHELRAKEVEDVSQMLIRQNQTQQQLNSTDKVKVLDLKVDEAMLNYQKLQDAAVRKSMTDSQIAFEEARAWNEVLAAYDALTQAKIEQSTKRLELDAMVRYSLEQNEFGEDMRITNEYERAQTEVEIAKTKYEQIIAAGRFETESYEEFQLRKAEAYSNYVMKEEDLMQKQMDITQSVTTAVVGGWGQIAEAIGNAADSNKDAVKLAKILGLAEIWINNGIAIAKAVSTQSQGDPYTMFARIASAIAQITASTITAVASLNKAKFAKGAVNIQGPGTTTSDSINARLSKGESVMTAKATKMFGTLLTIMNDVAAQPSVTLPTQYSTYNPMQTSVSREAMAESMKEAVSEMQVAVSVVDITEATDRVNNIKVLDTF